MSDPNISDDFILDEGVGLLSLSDSDSSEEYFIPHRPKLATQEITAPIQVQNDSKDGEVLDAITEESSSESKGLYRVSIPPTRQERYSSSSSSSTENMSNISGACSDDSTYEVHRVPIISNDTDEENQEWLNLMLQWRVFLEKRTRENNSRCERSHENPMGDSVGTHKNIRLSESSRARLRRENLRALARKMGFAPQTSVAERVVEATRDALRRNSLQYLEMNPLISDINNGCSDQASFSGASPFVTYVKELVTQMRDNSPQQCFSKALATLSKCLQKSKRRPAPKNIYSRQAMYTEEETLPEPESTTDDREVLEILEEQWQAYKTATTALKVVADDIILNHSIPNMTTQDMARSLWRQIVCGDTVPSAVQGSMYANRNQPQEMYPTTPPLEDDWREITFQNTEIEEPTEMEHESDWSVDDIDPVLLASIRQRDGPSPAQADVSEDGEEWDFVDRLTAREQLGSGCSDRASPQNLSPFERPQSVVPPENQHWGGFLWADQPDTVISEIDEIEVEEQEQDNDIKNTAFGNAEVQRSRQLLRQAGITTVVSRTSVTNDNSDGLPAVDTHPICSITIDEAEESSLPPEEPPPLYDSLFASAGYTVDPPPSYREATAMPVPQHRSKGAITNICNRTIDPSSTISDMIFETSRDDKFRLISRLANKSIQLKCEWDKDDTAGKEPFIEKSEHLENDKEVIQICVGGLAYDSSRGLYILAMPDSIIGIKAPTKSGLKSKIKVKISKKSSQNKSFSFESLKAIDYCASGDFYVVTDVAKHCVMIVNPSSKKIESCFGREGTNPHNGELKIPTSVKCCEFRGTENIAVSNHKNKCVNLFNMKGEVLQVLGLGVLGEPYGIYAVMEKIFVCDYPNKRVVCFNLNDADQSASIVLTSEQLSDMKPTLAAVCPDKDISRLAVIAYPSETDRQTFSLSDDLDRPLLRMFNTSLQLLKNL